MSKTQSMDKSKIEKYTCQQCHWLYLKYRKNSESCIEQGVRPNNTACERFELCTVEDIKREPNVVLLNTMALESLRPLFDETLMNELNTYLVFSIKLNDKDRSTDKSKDKSKDKEEHVARPVPLTFYQTEDWEALQQLVEQCQAYKDRVLDIQFNFVRVKQDLEKLWKQAEAYIVVNYSKVISNYKDAHQRKIITSYIFQALSDLEGDIKILTEKCEQVVSNLTSASYALKEIKDIAMYLFTIHLHKKGYSTHSGSSPGSSPGGSPRIANLEKTYSEVAERRKVI